MRCGIRLTVAAAAVQASLPQPASGIMSFWIGLAPLRRKNLD
jgi:hypothetical protein